MQSRNAVSAYLSTKQILPFGFAHLTLAATTSFVAAPSNLLMQRWITVYTQNDMFGLCSACFVQITLHYANNVAQWLERARRFAIASAYRASSIPAWEIHGSPLSTLGHVWFDAVSLDKALYP